MEKQQLDQFIFKLEKLLLSAECLSDYVGNPESYRVAFYSLLDDVQALGNVYANLETALQDML